VFGDRVKSTNPEKVDRLVRGNANDPGSSSDEEEGADDEDEEEGGVRMKGGAGGWESMDDE
jgi:hypothetical protein